jgi:hypothetical protein
MEATDIKDGSLTVINFNMEIRYGDASLVCFRIDEAVESADPSLQEARVYERRSRRRVSPYGGTGCDHSLDGETKEGNMTRGAR